MRAIRFLYSNPLYIFWFLLHFTIAWFILGADIDSLVLVSIIYTITISFALSEPGEYLLLILENCREPRTKQEKSYLLPIFEEVLQDAREINPEIREDTELYIKEVMYVDTFAVGKKSVVVTQGAIETFTDNELKGLIAHELGHITFGHTKAILLTSIGNLFFTIIVWFFRLLLTIARFISKELARKYFWGKVSFVLVFLTRVCTDVSVFLFINIGEIILAMNSRVNDMQADTFVIEVGYGMELISGLYLMQKITMTGEASLLERMKASNPNVAYRIEQLEEYEDNMY